MNWGTQLPRFWTRVQYHHESKPCEWLNSLSIAQNSWNRECYRWKDHQVSRESMIVLEIRSESLLIRGMGMNFHFSNENLKNKKFPPTLFIFSLFFIMPLKSDDGSEIGWKRTSFWINRVALKRFEFEVEFEA